MVKLFPKPPASAWLAAMSEGFDLRGLLESWPYDPENTARLGQGADGRPILQVRTPLGLEQYELEGRPDGQRPHGCDSVFDHHLQRLARARQAGAETGFELSEAECAELFDEGTLYYYRYLHLFQLKDWARTVRDTSRNLRLFDFVRRYAQHEDDQHYLVKWRPYIIRMNGVARAMIEVEKGAHDKACALVQSTIQHIDALEELEDETFKFERRRSLMALRELAGQIQSSKPLSEVERLERDLKRAVETQEFERAAQLRDRLRELRRKQSAVQS
jgi:hypothetical protein